jgi:hypothetical protein
MLSVTIREDAAGGNAKRATEFGGAFWPKNLRAGCKNVQDGNLRGC